MWYRYCKVSTVQQHLHRGYISLSWYDIPELVVHVMISLTRCCFYHGSYWTKGSKRLRWNHHFESFTVYTENQRHSNTISTINWVYRRVSLATTSLINHERGKDRILRQTEHIRDHLWPAYSVTVNHVLVSTVKLQIETRSKAGKAK
jgi:hypothetical protein